MDPEVDMSHDILASVMAPKWDSVAQLLSENTREIFVEVSELLLKFASNILKKPNEPKYRKIRLGNPVVRNKLLPISGAMEVLYEMGFFEDGDFLTMPIGSGLNTLRHIYEDLHSERNRLGAPTVDNVLIPSIPAHSSMAACPTASASAQASRTPGSGPATTTASEASQQTSELQNMHQMESTFMTKVQSSISHVMMYEDRTLQLKAREVIPVDQLQASADSNLVAINQHSTQRPGELPLDRRDFLLLELLKWFKTSFFQWVDAPPCEKCGSETRLMGGVEPLPQEQVWGASRIENYQCSSCREFTRFPRYNDPRKLLDTRRGRCGEWANCFTLCCRAVGFEARYILDWTDHVWTEVYSVSQRRWLHCDPCENVCDKPLLYEVGWGKKLTYVIAFSKDEVLDVTWRYSAKHQALLAGRRECRENWLCTVLTRLWKQKVDALPPSRKKELQHRLIVELVEFLTPKTADKQNLSGRTTGSVAWRQARGEMGESEASVESRPFVFLLTQEEKERELCHVQYCCATNRYIRLSSSDEETVGWRRCAHSVSDMVRKEERDWKMVYLSRSEGSSRAQITWKFDFTDSGLRIGKCFLKADTSVFETGIVTWTICADDQCIRLRGLDLLTLRELEVKGCRSLLITADLKGGSGDVAWQHTQLFRQELDSEYCPFEVKIHLV